MKPIKVSVIIPCYNVEKHIEMCLKSVYEQEYRNIEIICINDGSTDNTLEMIEKAKSTSPFPFIIINQSNAGASEARNVGLEKSKGEYIQFLDADDFLLANKISNQIFEIKQSEHPGLIVGSYKKISNTKQISEFHIDEQIQNEWLLLMKSEFGCTCSNLWKKQFVNEVGGWDTSLKSSQEYDLMFRLLKRNVSVSYSNQANTIIVQRENSISNTNLEGNWERYITLRLRIRDHVKTKVKEKYLEHEFNQIVFDSIRMLYKYNKKKSITFYNEHLPKTFHPRVSETSSRSYIFLFSLFGYEISEQIKNALNRIRPLQI